MDVSARDQRLTYVEDEIKAVERQVADVESVLLQHGADKEYLQGKVRQLREGKLIILRSIPQPSQSK